MEEIPRFDPKDAVRVLAPRLRWVGSMLVVLGTVLLAYSFFFAPFLENKGWFASTEREAELESLALAEEQEGHMIAGELSPATLAICSIAFFLFGMFGVAMAERSMRGAKEHE